PASDQYSLCCAIYEGLHGVPPFSVPPGPLAGARLLALKKSGPPLLPPVASVPAWVHKAIARGLAPAPENRHPSIPALMAALRETRDAPRRALWKTAGAALLIGGLLGIGIAGWMRSGTFRDPCQPRGGYLEGVWDEGVKDRVRAAFLGTGRPHAE